MATGLNINTLLSYKGMDAWLVDVKGPPLQHGPITVEGNQISATVRVKPNSKYNVSWRSCINSPPVSAWCEVYHSSTHAEVDCPRAASHFMDRSKLTTQHRSSRGRLELPFKRYGYMKVMEKPKVEGTVDLGSVRLEIRRAQGRISEVDIEDPSGEQHLCCVDIDIIDDQNENKPPYIIFNFNFEADAPSMPSQYNPIASKARDKVDTSASRQRPRKKDLKPSSSTSHSSSLSSFVNKPTPVKSESASSVSACRRGQEPSKRKMDENVKAPVSLPNKRCRHRKEGQQEDEDKELSPDVVGMMNRLEALKEEKRQLAAKLAAKIEEEQRKIDAMHSLAEL
ncbi:hypothetical protein BDQ12DRAFT_688997 [Crucibulum laeve]|uniref:Uncharacterized protein n=1 Tax=Crucibulum laeve TaxID=68775 RepID=A0A5C3LQ83_9AGAR|nr:hypothetical protein BDQ12DRAFT_688997 [Crucibulum laeve]